jgi:hypothetical protein
VVFQALVSRLRHVLITALAGQVNASSAVCSPDFGGVTGEAIRRVLHGQNRHRSDGDRHGKPGRSPLAVLD